MLGRGRQCDRSSDKGVIKASDWSHSTGGYDWLRTTWGEAGRGRGRGLLIAFYDRFRADPRQLQ